MKLNELEKDVKALLVAEPKTRASDDLLYFMLIEDRLQKMGKSLARISAQDYILHYRNYNLPTIESVGRCRRKLQEKNATLKPSSSVVLHRKEMEKSFYNYSIGALGLEY